MPSNSCATESRLPDFSSDSSFGESYDLIRELGRGGMAIVYLVRERATGEERAVKVIHTKFVDDTEALARFDREARLVAQLQHPHIVATHAVQWIEGVGFGLVMDHVRGRTLKQIIADGVPIPFDTATRILDDVAAALSFAHGRGIVHRDVKPENIFVEDSTGHALLADFGIARSMQSETQLTLAGAAIGTPTYMAPEQIDGAAVDARSDLYSLGLVGWEMLTGRRPWDGESLYNVIYRQKHDHLAPIDALRPDTPQRLVVAIEGLLEKSPARRWQSAEEFHAQLHSSAEPVRRSRGDVEPATDATVLVPIRRAEPPSLVRRLAPLAAAVALLMSGTLLFARPAPSWVPLVHHSTKTREVAAGRRMSGAALPTRSRSASPGTGDAAAVGDAAPSTPVSSAAQPASLQSPSAATSDSLATISRIAALPAARGSALDARLESIAAPRPLIPTPSNAPFALAAGGTHTCLVSSAGAAYCWGANNDGQLGDGATQTRTTPTPVSGDARFVGIAAGLSHTCALSARSSVFCWGNNESGELGDGTHAAHDVPQRVIYARPLVSVVSGAGFSCALTDARRPVCWGAGSRGQIGDGAQIDRATPSEGTVPTNLVSLAAGWNHVCGLSQTGTAYCWGANDAGQLGDGTDTDRATPTEVLTSLHFLSLSAGNAHTCGVTTAHAIYCWGSNAFGQLGDGSRSNHPTPVDVAASTKFSSVSAGGLHTCALTVRRDAMCWGRNTYGQLGNGEGTSASKPTPVVGDHNFASIKAFGAHTCGATITGDLFCWGYNLDGELGDGTREHRARPTYIDKPAG